jgi:prophage DNA circulation protein
MNKVSTQAQVTVLSREQAIARAGWILAGEATSWIAPVLLARDVQEALGEVRALILAFSTPGDGFSESMTAFLEKARLEAARILRERGANQPRPAGEEEVPF